ncbi:MAG: hypothetical protein KDA92_27310, partial [Planctomycetales bacterium]|nr:hypothetical protein [Planctomycetales bacterium]
VTLRRYILDVHDLFEGVALVIAFSAVTVTVLRSVMAVGSVIVSFFKYKAISTTRAKVSAVDAK